MAFTITRSHLKNPHIAVVSRSNGIISRESEDGVMVGSAHMVPVIVPDPVPDFSVTVGAGRPGELRVAVPAP